MADPPRLPSWSDWASGDWFGAGRGARRGPPGPAELTEAFQKLIGGSVGSSVDLGPAAPQLLVDQLIELARDRLVGRPITTRVKDGELRFVPERIEAQPSAIDLAVGQLGDITVAATDLRWARDPSAGEPAPAWRADHVEVRFRNVHVKPGRHPQVVSAPVDVTVTAGADALGELAAARARRWAVDLDDHGVALVGLADRGRWGRAELTPRLEGDRIRLVATGVRAAGRRLGLGRGVPTVAVRLPRLPSSWRIHEVELRGATVVVTGAVDELRRPLSLSQLKDLRKKMSDGADRYDLTAAEADDLF